MVKTLLGFTSLVLVALPAMLAAAEPDDVIKYRQAAMKALGGHMAAMAQIVRGKVPYEERLESHARAVGALSAGISDLFPEGSDFGETDAQPEIWSKRAEFDKAADAMREAGEALATAAAGGDASVVAKAFSRVSDACKSCHEDFRKKD